MKMFSTCMECLRELGHPSFEPMYVDYYDDRVGSVMCARGHKSLLMLQSQKFEVLMESGANALLEGFTLEACSSFASALERAIEFALRVLCTARGMSSEAWTATYSEIARQSERQLGAFIVEHTLAFGSPYKPLKKFVEIRNRVIHKGEILNLKEASRFCALAYEEIVKIMSSLKHKFESAVQECVRHDVAERSKSLEPGPRAHTSGCSFYSLTFESDPRPFSDALTQHRKALELVRGAEEPMRALFAALGGAPAA